VSYVLQVVSKRVDQALVPMRNFIIGGAGLQTRHFSLDGLLEPRREEVIVRSPPPTKAADFLSLLDTQKLSSWVGPLRSPARDPHVEKSPYMRRSSGINTPPSVYLAQQSTLVDSLALHDSLEQPEQDPASVPAPQIPLALTVDTAVPVFQDCPWIDLVALVREKQKAKKLQKNKPPSSRSPKKLHRRVVPKGSNLKFR
jgi:hypothetical protein